MRLLFIACLAAPVAIVHAAQAGEWKVETIEAPARVTSIETADGAVRVIAGGLTYRVVLDGKQAALAFVDQAAEIEPPEGALPDGRVATGTRDIARAWLSEPTRRYDHGVLGDKIEASSVTLEERGGKRSVVRLKDDAVFEDLHPRLADLNGDGLDEIVVVKSYLARGSALAVIGSAKGRYEIVAETPPLGSANRWLDPAGIADFNGDGKVDIALVRQPHVVGMLELWTFADGRLRKTGEFPDVTNHVIGSRAIDMGGMGDFDGDGIADLALPSLDRKRLRIIGFVPQAHEIASIALPAKAVTDSATSITKTGPALVLGLEDGKLAVVRRAP